jgi:hypothetical protein
VTKTDPIVAALNSAVPTGGGGVGAIERIFEKRPAVFKSIIDAHNRGVTKTEIARLLTQGAPEGVRISDGQVKTWLDKNLPKTLS